MQIYPERQETSHAPFPSSPCPEGMLSYCTWAQDAASTKAQKENWLVSCLKNHRYLLSQEGHTDASELTTDMHSKAIGCSGMSQTAAMQQLLDLAC